MIDNKNFWSAITETGFNKEENLSKLNTMISKSEGIIEKILEENNIDSDNLRSEYSSIISERCSMAYTQGVEDGVKLLNLLLSGNTTNHMLQIHGLKATTTNEIDMIKLNAKNGYAKRKKGVN